MVRNIVLSQPVYKEKEIKVVHLAHHQRKQNAYMWETSVQ